MPTVITNADLGKMAPDTAAKPAKNTFFRRVMDALARRAEQNAMARLSALDPRLAAEIRAARDRSERELYE